MWNLWMMRTLPRKLTIWSAAASLVSASNAAGRSSNIEYHEDVKAQCHPYESTKERSKEDAYG